MKLRICLILFLFTIVNRNAFSQHDHETGKKELLTFNHVLSQFLSDSALTGYKMESTVMTVAPGAVDTVSHFHDCDLFGYVLEGEIQIGLNKKLPATYTKGQMFFEKRRILHSLTRNNFKDKPTKILLIFIIKDGREGYTKAY